MTTQQFTFEEHDKLNRKPFAEFLLSLIQHRNEYRRPDSNKSYSIAIDAVYGSGKTRFLQMFQSMIKQTGSYNIAYYSAWEHDLYDDALAPILSLLDQPAGVFDEQAYTRMEKTLGIKALRVLKRMGTSFLSMKAKKHFGEDYEEIIDDIKALFNEKNADPDAYDLRMKCTEELQNGLKKATEDNPLIFIIDELDRCNPAFAIKTLEVAKHLLDVDNVIFVFALDMHQMRAAVRKFYGQDIDADGYLYKIFDYMMALPTPILDNYVRYSLDRIEEDFADEYPALFRYVCKLMLQHRCSLRMIDTLVETYCIMWHSFVHQYNSPQAHILYFYIVYMKYTNPTSFSASAQDSALLKTISSTIHSDAHNQKSIQALSELWDETIVGADLIMTKDDEDNKVKSISTTDDTVVLEFVGSSMMKMFLSPMSESNVNSLLFFPDLIRFDSIKHLTYSQFFHRQLEMYNPIRSENPESNTPTT